VAEIILEMLTVKCLHSKYKNDMLIERLLKRQNLDGIRIEFKPFVTTDDIRIMAVKEKDKTINWQARYDITIRGDYIKTAKMWSRIQEDFKYLHLDRMAYDSIIDLTNKKWKDYTVVNARNAILDVIEKHILKESGMGRSIDLVEVIEDIHYDPLVYQFIAPFSTKESLTIDLDLEERFR